MNTNLEVNDSSLLSTKLKILLLLHSFGALDSSDITEKFRIKYRQVLKKGSLHGTLSRLRIEGLVKSKVEIKKDKNGNEIPIQLYKESSKGLLEIEKIIRDIENTTELKLLPT